MPTVTVGKWGNSLALRIPGEVAAAARLGDGDTIELEVREDCVVLRQAAPRFTAESMFAGRSAAEWRRMYANAYDWGPDLGREIVPET